jgi:hypothetical protein
MVPFIFLGGYKVSDGQPDGLNTVLYNVRVVLTSVLEPDFLKPYPDRIWIPYILLNLDPDPDEGFYDKEYLFRYMSF